MVEWFLLIRVNQQKVTFFIDLFRLQIIKYNAEDLDNLSCFNENNDLFPLQ